MSGAGARGRGLGPSVMARVRRSSGLYRVLCPLCTGSSQVFLAGLAIAMRREGVPPETGAWSFTETRFAVAVCPIGARHVAVNIRARWRGATGYPGDMRVKVSLTKPSGPGQRRPRVAAGKVLLVGLEKTLWRRR